MLPPLRIKLQIGGSYYDLSGITNEDMAALVAHVAACKEIVERYQKKKAIPYNPEEEDV